MNASSQSAFTLMELLISLSIIAILMAISFPAAHDFMTRTQDEILQAQLLRAIEIAKREARATHTPVALCQSNNQMTCAGNWQDGQLIFLDEQMDGVVHGNDQILTVMRTQSQHGSIHWRAFPGYRHYLLFLPTGFLHSDNGTFWHCHADKPIWAIIISKVGRTRVALPDEKGEIRDSHGKLLSC